MKHLKLFNTVEEYEAFKGGGDYSEPNVSYVVGNSSIINNRIQLPSQEKSITITEDGITEIVPDVDYRYLDKVTIETKVSPLEPKDINFFDYDGTLLYAYTWDEGRKLTELPAAPTHEGLVFQEWNYTIDDIRAQGINGIKGKADIIAVFTKNGEIVKHPLVYFCERGGEFDTTSYQYIKVCSIPNTVTELSDMHICNSVFEKELVIPVNTQTYYGYGVLYACVLPSVWYAVTDIPGYFLAGSAVSKPVFFPAAVNIGTLQFGDSYSCYIKYSETTESLTGIDAHCSINDFSDCSSVVSIESGAFGSTNTIIRAIFIIPDVLYDDWVNSTNWCVYYEAVPENFIKASKYFI